MRQIERIQTGLRMERRIIKVLKATAEYLDVSTAELVEAMALHAFEGKSPFSEKTLAKIARIREVYELDLTADDSHHLAEKE